MVTKPAPPPPPRPEPPDPPPAPLLEVPIAIPPFPKPISEIPIANRRPRPDTGSRAHATNPSRAGTEPGPHTAQRSADGPSSRAAPRRKQDWHPPGSVLARVPRGPPLAHRVSIAGARLAAASSTITRAPQTCRSKTVSALTISSHLLFAKGTRAPPGRARRARTAGIGQWRPSSGGSSASPFPGRAGIGATLPRC